MVEYPEAENLTRSLTPVTLLMHTNTQKQSV